MRRLRKVVFTGKSSMINFRNEQLKFIIIESDYFQKWNLVFHSKKHTGVLPYNCDICGQGCRSQFVRNLHRRSHFPTSDQKIYKCPYCDKQFTRSFTRNVHVKIHTREQPSPCDICGRQFKLVETMQRHRKSHGLSDPVKIKQEPEDNI